MFRRTFIAAAAASAAMQRSFARPGAVDKPAILGGKPIRKTKFPAWPVFDTSEEKSVTDVLRSGRWNRGAASLVGRFEEAYARRLESASCLATSNGTSALLTALNALEIGPGDEVIVPPYTFVATVNVVLQRHALPVFVDTDPSTFQIDARKLEAAITPRTAAIMPVHLGGNVADLDSILGVAARRGVPVIEDACQAHLAEWRGRCAGTLGRCGAFSFQASKNLNCGEGGALVSNDRDFIERCYAFHNNSRGRDAAGHDFSYRASGLNLRLTEFQAAVLLAQMKRIEDQSRIRERNARSLTEMLQAIPGIEPARMYSGCTRNAYHLYMFRYDPARFAGLSRDRFLKALHQEGIPASGGYSPLNQEPFLKNTLESRAFRRVYGDRVYSQWQERNQCPWNDALCSRAVWFTQTMLLGPPSDMEEIAAAIRKIHANSGALATA